MGQYEDVFYEIHEDINRKGLRQEFDAQLKKMRHQDKHKYLEPRDRWKYAHAKVVKLFGNKIGK